MGHHLTDDGQFKSDRHPDLPAGKIVLSFKDPHAQLGLWVTAMDERNRLMRSFRAAVDHRANG